MDNKDDVLPIRQQSGGKDVGTERNSRHGHDEKGSMPVGRRVGAVVYCDDALYKRTDDEQALGVASLPGKRRGPSGSRMISMLEEAPPVGMNHGEEAVWLLTPSRSSRSFGTCLGQTR